MSTIPMPTDVSVITELSEALDAADHGTRLLWVRSLGGKQQYRLFELAEGNPVTIDDLVRDDREVVIHHGRNGMMVFNRFQKRFARMGDVYVGYNVTHYPALLRPIAERVSGPGHYVAYDSPEKEGEVWIDYRRIPEERHPDFPPLIDNESGLRALVFGNMVDIIRRVSEHVFIGDAFRNLPREGDMPFMARVARLSPTAPFVLCQE